MLSGLPSVSKTPPSLAWLNLLLGLFFLLLPFLSNPNQGDHKYSRVKLYYSHTKKICWFFCLFNLSLPTSSSQWNAKSLQWSTTPVLFCPQLSLYYHLLNTYFCMSFLTTMSPLLAHVGMLCWPFPQFRMYFSVVNILLPNSGKVSAFISFYMSCGKWLVSVR